VTRPQHGFGDYRVENPLGKAFLVCSRRAAAASLVELVDKGGLWGFGDECQDGFASTPWTGSRLEGARESGVDLRSNRLRFGAMPLGGRPLLARGGGGTVPCRTDQAL
jgi:hypothetical protein